MAITLTCQEPELRQYAEAYAINRRAQGALDDTSSSASAAVITAARDAVTATNVSLAAKDTAYAAVRAAPLDPVHE